MALCVGILVMLSVVANMTFVKAEKAEVVPVPRNVLQFGSLIQCPYGREPGFGSVVTSFRQYNGYGCYCGKNDDSEGINILPVHDATDRCCQIHDDCYRDAGLEDGLLELVRHVYNYTCTGAGYIRCNEANTTSMKRKLCDCDKAASNCFFDKRTTYNETLLHASRDGLCEISAGVVNQPASIAVVVVVVVTLISHFLH